MAEIYIDVDSAVTVPVNIFPLIDDTTFKDREVAVAYNATGLDLVWNFVTTAGAMSQTAVTPTDTGGAYDWVHIGDGMYTIEIPASGGASINNDTEGFGWFTGIATGVLAWRSPIFGFRAAGLNNTMIDSAYSTTRGLAGTALPDTAADAAGGLPISDAGGLDLDAQIKTDIDDLITRLTAARAGYLDKLNVSGALAHSDAAATYKADVSGLATAVNLATVDGKADAIKLKTDNLPSDPADQSAVEAAITALVTAVYDALVTIPAVSLGVPADGEMVIYTGDTLHVSISDLGSLADLDKLYVSFKESYDNEDSESILQLEESQGLLVVNGATASLTDGSITIDDAVDGDITIDVVASVMDDITVRSCVYDVKVIRTAGVAVQTLHQGKAWFHRSITKAVS